MMMMIPKLNLFFWFSLIISQENVCKYYFLLLSFFLWYFTCVVLKGIFFNRSWYACNNNRGMKWNAYIITVFIITTTHLFLALDLSVPSIRCCVIVQSHHLLINNNHSPPPPISLELDTKIHSFFISSIDVLSLLKSDLGSIIIIKIIIVLFRYFSFIRKN